MTPAVSAWLHELTRRDFMLAAGSAPIGKRLPSDLYVHVSSLPTLPDLFQKIIQLANEEVGNQIFTIAKLGLSAPVISYLHYPDFDEDAHPSLRVSTRFDLKLKRRTHRDYTHHSNPPILHRKEMFVSKDYPLYEIFKRLTESEVEKGLLAVPRIGFKKQWEEALLKKNIRIVGHRLMIR